MTGCQYRPPILPEGVFEEHGSQRFVPLRGGSDWGRSVHNSSLSGLSAQMSGLHGFGRRSLRVPRSSCVSENPCLLAGVAWNDYRTRTAERTEEMLLPARHSPLARGGLR